MELTKRQAEIGALVAEGLPDKVIASRLEISIDGVRARIQAAAARIPGEARPRHKLTLWFANVMEGNREDKSSDDKPDERKELGAKLVALFDAHKQQVEANTAAVRELTELLKQYVPAGFKKGIKKEDAA